MEICKWLILSSLLNSWKINLIVYLWIIWKKIFGRIMKELLIVISREERYSLYYRHFHIHPLNDYLNKTLFI